MQMPTINKQYIFDDCYSFGEVMSDGRLTMPSDGKAYRLREAIRFKEKIGRLLTAEELASFEVHTQS